jgi:hypothetical protein
MMTGRTRARVRPLVILVIVALMTLGALPVAAAPAADATPYPAHSGEAAGAPAPAQPGEPEEAWGPAQPAEAEEPAESGEVAVSDVLVVYESGYAVGTRTIQAELQPGPNRLIVGGLPATVDARSAELASIGERVRVESRIFNSADRSFVFTVVPEAPGLASFRLTYTFTGLAWSASYIAVLDGLLDEVSLSAWYCLSNKCGSSVASRNMTLVAGNANSLGGKADARGAVGLGVTAVGVSCPNTIPDGADCYLQAASAGGVPVRMVYLIDRIGVTLSDPAVNRKDETPVFLALDMTVSGPDLPLPLPAGRVTVYTHSQDGTAHLLGEDTMGPIRAAGSVMLRLGKAPSLRVEKARTDQKKIGTSSWEEAYQIRITNLGSVQADVVIVEEFPGEWAILQSAPVAAGRTPSGSARFNLPVPAGARTEVLYRVRYTL